MYRTYPGIEFEPEAIYPVTQLRPARQQTPNEQVQDEQVLTQHAIQCSFSTRIAYPIALEQLFLPERLRLCFEASDQMEYEARLVDLVEQIVDERVYNRLV